MIKSVHRLYETKNRHEYNALVDLFGALGLVPGESWEGRRSTGMKLESTSSGVEIGFGEGFPAADLVIEVDKADAAYDRMRALGVKVADRLVDCDWGARMFVIELPAVAGRVAIFSYNQPWRPEELAAIQIAKKKSRSAKSRASARAAAGKTSSKKKNPRKLP